MKTAKIRKTLMAVIIGLATSFFSAGLLLGDEELMVVGWLHAITYMLWRYGQTLEKS